MAAKQAGASLNISIHALREERDHYCIQLLQQ